MSPQGREICETLPSLRSRQVNLTDVTGYLSMGFFFYPLRRFKLFTFVRVSWITFVPSDCSVLFSFILTFVHSFDVGKINRMDHAILDWFTAGNIPPSRVTDVFPSSTSQLFFFSSPLLLAITFQSSAIPTVAKPLLSSPPSAAVSHR
jgi:hypothetical protein